jgi:hypothetical protein
MNTVARIGLAIAFAVRSAEPAAQVSQSPGGQSIFKSGVELVTLYVTVIGPSITWKGSRRTNSGFENGRREQLKFFQSTGLPLALTLLVDSSSSVQHVLPEFQRAAVRFLSGLQPEDIASLVTFGDTVRVVQNFTSDCH